jgi:hypothetical protein
MSLMKTRLPWWWRSQLSLVVQRIFDDSWVSARCNFVVGENGRHARRRSIMPLSDVPLRAVRYDVLMNGHFE